MAGSADSAQGAGVAVSADGGPSSSSAAKSQSTAASDRPDYLKVLSAAQYSAVTAPPHEPLQILAGPGSGKTRVLVARVAWLILEHNVDPRDLVVVTFTNKAANEMRHRLTALIGQHRTSLLILGTFHATCARYLRQHATLVGLTNSFSICDADQSKTAIKSLLKQETIKKQLEKPGLPQPLKPDIFTAEISRAKAKDMSPEAFDAWLTEIEAGRQSTTGANTTGRPENTAIRRAVSVVYKAYTAYLRENNALDFDDLLVYGVKLFRENARVTANIHHVLVDEFQDTNTIQYALMATLAGRAGSRGAVSIVGDPDQSIYGWRSAEVGNLKKMAEEFASWSEANAIRRVFLEENYRSTGHILQTAKAVIDCDSNRIERGLFTSHAQGPPPVCKQFANSQYEAMFVATEIKRMMAASGGMLQYDDFAILLRFNALSREIEQQLQSENIPSRMMGGARFFERKEVKEILAYLTLADNPTFTPAMERVINVPKRALGDKSVKEVMALAAGEGVRAMAIVDRVASADQPIMGFRQSVQASMKSFVNIIKELRDMALKHKPVPEIIERAIKLTDYEKYLRKEPDFDQRWENVKELINFSFLVSGAMQQEGENGLLDATDGLASSPMAPTSTQATDVVDLLSSDEDVKSTPASTKRLSKKKSTSKSESPESIRSSKSRSRSASTPASARFPGLFEAEEPTEVKSPLRVFLEAATLSTDMEQDDEDGKKPKVTIATTHAAKGLEFPVVFVLAVEEDTYPFYRSTGTLEQIDEEARLLYVGVTRAQAMVYLTHCQNRLVNGETKFKTLSRFVSPAADPDVVVGGSWGKNTQIGYGGQTPAAPKCEKVPYIKTRPAIGTDERRAMAAVLNRPVAPDDLATALLSQFENSDVGVRARRADEDVKTSTLPSWTFYNPAGNMFSRTMSTQAQASSSGSSSLFGSNGVRSHVAPSTSSVGFSTATAALRNGQGGGSSKSSYDSDGWAVETKAGAASSAARSQHNNGYTKPMVKRNTSTFMDPYRASKGGVAHDGVIGAASAHALHERPTADAARFKASNDSSISSILSLLPDDGSGSQSARGASASSNRSHGQGAGSSKKRLGMGRPATSMTPSKEARRGP